ncbi:MAG: hypothetical protein CM1200mP27_07680 [Chloroflexota bacterium]|nr:MAG: hypothetical protein CM1200mP27_07680 [Chloroflexota bacterium]
MLACARIGAVHSVVYAGFSVGSLRGRIQDPQAKVVITADVGYRRGNEVDLKGICDETVADMDLVEHVVVWNRKGPPESRGPKDIDFDQLLADSSIDCQAEEMVSRRPAVHPLYQWYHRYPQGSPTCPWRLHGWYLLPF